MRETYIKEKLQEIGTESDRKEVLRIYEDVILQMNEYQEQCLYSILGVIQRQMTTDKRDYAIKTYLSTYDVYKKYSDQLTILNTTGFHENITWGDGVIKTIWYTKSGSIEGRVLKAYAITNYEKYPVEVIIKKNTVAQAFADRMDRLYTLHSVNIPKVNRAYMDRFYDVCFESVEDRLREDEVLKDIQIFWEGIEDQIMDDVVLLWNVIPKVYKENNFPFPQGNRMKYGHEIAIDSLKNGILLDVDTDEMIEYEDLGNQFFLYTKEKNYKAHRVYEICGVKPLLQEELGKEVGNYVRDSVLSSMQKEGRHLTEGELYRRITQYQVIEFFDRVEVNSLDNIIFYASDDEYEFAEQMMNYILDDINLLYCTDRFKGILRLEKR